MIRISNSLPESKKFEKRGSTGQWTMDDNHKKRGCLGEVREQSPASFQVSSPWGAIRMGPFPGAAACERRWENSYPWESSWEPLCVGGGGVPRATHGRPILRTNKQPSNASPAEHTKLLTIHHTVRINYLISVVLWGPRPPYKTAAYQDRIFQGF